MEKPLFEQIGGTYTRVGDHYFPVLTLPTEKKTYRCMGTETYKVFEDKP